MASSPDQESFSGGMSEETGAAAGASGKSSMYSSQDDSFLFSDTTTSGADGGLWHSPTSPGTTQLLLHFSFFQVQNLCNSAVYCILHLS